MSEHSNHSGPNQSGGAVTGLSEDDQRVLDGLETVAQEELEAALPNPRLVILQGLLEAGEGEALSETDKILLADHKDGLAKALEDHEALVDQKARVSDDAKLFNEAWAEHLTASRKPIRSRRASRVRWPARIGLGLSALTLASLIYVAGVQESNRLAVTAPQDSNLLVTLADGSTARLSPGSSLTYLPGAEFNRAVDLDGTAFFDVVSRSPGFTVETAQARTTVLGTRFSVSGRSDHTEVVLVSGKVAVAPLVMPDAIVVLEPGQSTRVDRATPPSTPEVANIPKALSWTHLLIFRETPMSDVVASIEAVRGVTVIVDSDLAALQVSGTFEPEQSAEEVLAILAATLQAEVLIQEDGTFRLRSASN